MRFQVERLGGFAGMGGPGARLRSTADLDSEALSQEERQQVESLFAAKQGVKPARTPDAFVYRLTRESAGATESVEVAEHELPENVRSQVKDRLV